MRRRDRPANIHHRVTFAGNVRSATLRRFRNHHGARTAGARSDSRSLTTTAPPGGSALARVIRTALLFALFAAFASFVWPTRWRYDHMTVDGDLVPVRIDRFTGEADMLVQDSGWIPVEAPTEAAPGEPTQRSS